ncbi:MAG: hypothetical protein ACR2NG_06720 [Acidimicrobiia bacterium]
MDAVMSIVDVLSEHRISGSACPQSGDRQGAPYVVYSEIGDIIMGSDGSDYYTA